MYHHSRPTRRGDSARGFGPLARFDPHTLPVADAESHLQQAQTNRDTAVQHRTEVLAAFADLLGPAEAAHRLALTPTAVRTAQRAAARHRPPDTAQDSVDRAGPAAIAAPG